MKKNLFVAVFMFCFLFGCNSSSSELNGCWSIIESPSIEDKVGDIIEISDTKLKFKNAEGECKFTKKDGKHIASCEFNSFLGKVKHEINMEIKDKILIINVPNVGGSYNTIKAEKTTCPKK